MSKKDAEKYADMLPLLIKDLQKNSRSSQLRTIETLSAHGPASLDAVPELTKLANGEDPHVARAARNAIEKIERKPIG